MIKFFFISLLLPGLFNSKLEVIDYKSIDKSVMIVCDHIYCKDCLSTIARLQYLWDKKYKTIFITKSKRKVSFTKNLINLFKDKLKFSEIYFVEANNYYGFSNLIVGKYEINRSPSIIIKKGEFEKYLSFDKMFTENYDSLSIKRILLKYIK